MIRRKPVQVMQLTSDNTRQRSRLSSSPPALLLSATESFRDILPHKRCSSPPTAREAPRSNPTNRFCVTARYWTSGGIALTEDASIFRKSTLFSSLTRTLLSPSSPVAVNQVW